MSENDDDKVEVRVVVESKDSSRIDYHWLWGAFTLALVGALILLISGGGIVEDLLLRSGDSGEGNCGDGIDNDKGGQADDDDPDCYSNPEVWEGYDPNRTEANRDNDPPGGSPEVTT